MGLFSFISKKNDKKNLLGEALKDYKNSDYDECYEKVCSASEDGNARACFCKALLIYNDNVYPDSTPDFEVLKDLVGRAVKGGYSLAYGFYAYILHTLGETEELCEFLSDGRDVKDGVFLSYKASYLFGLYNDVQSASDAVVISTVKRAISYLQELKKQIESGLREEAEEYSLYNPYVRFSYDYVYGHANFILLTAYYCDDNGENRREFMNAFEKIMRYMPVESEKFRASKQYLNAILKNRLRMSDFNEANRAMNIVNECFSSLTEEEREAYDDDYSEIYDRYSEFYEIESQKRQSREVTYSDGNANKNDVSFSNVAQAIGRGISEWANNQGGDSQTTVYTINGVKYTRGDYGYLYDENGYRSGYKVDDYSRLYDEDGNELGYFNYQGVFIGGYN